eukprot:scaffold127978_cov65-Attheya_sp.AAC.2
MLGLTDIATEGNWVWSDGSEVSFTKWGGMQPDNSNNEDCVHTYSGNLWNDNQCTTYQALGVYKLPASSLCAATNGQGYTCYKADSTARTLDMSLTKGKWILICVASNDGVSLGGSFKKAQEQHSMAFWFSLT